MVAEALNDDTGRKSPWVVMVDKIFEMAELNNSALEVPRNIHLNEKEDSLVIEYSWFKLKYLALLFVVPLCSYVIVESGQIQGSLDNITFPVAIVLLLNIFVVYYCLTRLLNTTLISVNRERIKIRHQPLPLMKSHTILRKDLKQLYVTRKMRTKRHNFYSSTYQINAILANDHVVTVLSGFSKSTQGRFIEHKIEQFLGIADIAVDGEIEK